jgi:acetylglutamate kinase
VNTPHDREATMGALLRALPYIRLYRGRVFVLKLGGEAVADAESMRRVVEQIGVLSELGVRVVIVHGGGPQTTALAERLGLPTRIVGGRRVTTPETLEVAIMTMNGTVNTAVLAACRAAGIAAVGVSGVDSGIVRARRRPPVETIVDGRPTVVDCGEVGDVMSVDGPALERLLDDRFVPVVSPLSADEAGNVLNVNADTVASAIACALGAEKLIFLTAVPGILEDRADPGSLISYIDLPGLLLLEGRGALDGGMLPKVNAARGAILGGVKRVHIVGFRQPLSLLVEVFTNEGAGTLVVRDRAELSPGEQAP